MQAAVSDAGCGECAEACKVCGIADWRGCEAEDGAGGGSGQGGLVGPAPGSSFSSTVSCGFRVAARSIRGSSLGSSGCFVEANGYMPSASAELPCSSRRLCDVRPCFGAGAFVALVQAGSHWEYATLLPLGMSPGGIFTLWGALQ